MRKLRITIAVVVGLSMAAIAGIAKAHDDPEVLNMNIGGGMICDKLEQVVEFIEGAQQSFPEGCGRLMGTRDATITLLPDHIRDGKAWHLAQYEFKGDVPWGVPIQFGVWGRQTPTDLPNTKGMPI